MIASAQFTVVLRVASPEVVETGVSTATVVQRIHLIPLGVSSQTMLKSNT
jgi:hypothetical protein